jgi:microcompartment protein CcmK/EutM
MRVGRVIGSVVSTVKDESLTGAKLLVVAPIQDAPGSDEPIVAVDGVGAGRGEVVLVATGSAARALPTTRNSPVDAAIVAIVDRLESDNWSNYQKD